ncbi:MAG TPA: peptidylprolyl isomerase [bacterium]|nr:peptidylprolyl isomerase [bacterium]
MILYIVFSLFLANLEAKVLNQVLAKVDQEPVFYSEMEEKLKPVLQEYQKMMPKIEQEKDKIKMLKEELLGQMIEEKLLVQDARKKGIKVTEKEVSDGLKEIRGRFATEKEFGEELKQQGITELQMEKRVRDQLMVIKLIEQEVRSKMTAPSDEELKKFYSENENEMWEPEKVRVRHILIRVSTGTDKASARKKIEQLASLVKVPGADFGELAKQYSEGPSAPQGGDLGFFARGEMLPEFEETAFNLKVGEMSAIVETSFGYHIIKCIGRKAEEKKNFEDIKEDLRNYLFQLKMEESYRKYIRKLRDKASIEIDEAVLNQ